LERYQQILADFSRMAADSSDVSALLQLTAVQAVRGIGIGHTKVLQHRPAFGDLLTVAGLGWRPGVVFNKRFASEDLRCRRSPHPPRFAGGSRFCCRGQIMIGRGASLAGRGRFSCVSTPNDKAAEAGVLRAAGGIQALGSTHCDLEGTQKKEPFIKLELLIIGKLLKLGRALRH
jgi:hypothetical protein